MSLIKQIALRDARIMNMSMSAGNGGVETHVKIHAPVDAETAELIGGQAGILQEILESAKSRFRMLSTDVHFEGEGNFASKKADVSGCEANRFTLKTSGDVGDGNEKAKVLHVVFSLTFGKPNAGLFKLYSDLGNAPLLMKLSGDTEAQQTFEFDSEAAKAAAKKARERAGGEKDPADRLTELYEEIMATMKAADTKMPNYTTPLANASRPDLMRVVKRAGETSEDLERKIRAMVDEILTCRAQVKNREQLQDAIQS